MSNNFKEKCICGTERYNLDNYIKNKAVILCEKCVDKFEKLEDSGWRTILPGDELNDKDIIRKLGL